MRALAASPRLASAAERMAQSVRHRAQPDRATLLLLTRLAALVLALVALLAPRLAAAHAESAVLARLAASTHLAAAPITPQRGTTPIPPGCAERSPSSASASTALGGIDSASAPRARALAMGGRPPAGGETVLERDGRGNLLWARDPLGNLTRYDRDPRGLLTAIYHPAGGITRAQWDHQGNLIAVQQPDGGVWRFTYDFLGRRLSATDPLGHATHYTYSPRGDLLAVRDALGQVTRYSYDGEGQLTQAVSPANHITKLEWGGYHKLVRRTDPNGHKVRLGYNVEGELTHVWNERGELHTLEYTSAGLLREEHTFDGRTLSYRHDQAGRPIAIRNGAGELTELEYDPAGQLVLRKLHDDTEEKFTYSLLGDLVAVEAPGLRLAFQRDALGQIVREEQTYAGQTHAVDIAYDPDGERIARRTTLGHVEEVQRDAAGHRRLTRLDGREIAHAVDLFGRELARQLPGGGRLESSFDALGRLADRRALGPERELPALAGQPEHLGPRRTNVSAYKAFRYDADGELVETIDRDRGKTQFKYDPVGQLLAMVPERARAELFRYDKTGNLHEDGAGADQRVYAKGNRLLQKGDTHYTWDRDGRLLEKRTQVPADPAAPPNIGPAPEQVWQYTWNAAGLLHRARSSDGTIVECAYDPFARRIEKRVYEQKSKLGAPTLQARTRFVWDGDVLVHELREQGLASGDPVVEERTYWFEDGGFEPLAHREKRVDDVGRESGGWFHYKNDPIGTPERLVAEDGSVAAEYERKAWGQLEQRAGAKASTPIRLQGQYWDEETGLAYNRWRYYDGEGRFVSADPLGLGAGPHVFGFGHSATAWADPLGLVSRSGAFRAAKRDVGIPMNEVPSRVRRVPLRDLDGGIVRKCDGSPVVAREYDFDKYGITIQEHSRGHTSASGLGAQPPHFNVRAQGTNKTADGALDHYPFER